MPMMEKKQNQNVFVTMKKIEKIALDSKFQGAEVSAIYIPFLLQVNP